MERSVETNEVPPEPAAPAPNREGHWHSLKAHLLGTAQRAAAFAEPLGLAEAAWWSGVWHDIGKASLCTFQPSLALAATDRQAADRRFPPRDRSHKGQGQLVDRSAIRHLGRFRVSVRAEWATRFRRAGYLDPVEEVDGHLRLARWLGAHDERLGVVGPDGEPAVEK